MHLDNSNIRRQDRICNDEATLVSLLDRVPMIHVAMNDEIFPHVVPLSFGYEFVGEKLTFYFHGASSGRKVTLWKKDSHVAFSIVEPGPVHIVDSPVACRSGQDFLSILGQGIIREVPLEKRQHAVEKIMQRYSQDKNKTWNFPETALNAMGVFELEVTKMSAKRRHTS